MKRISDAEAQKINDFSLESSVALPAYVLEKDMHVCDAMKILAAIPTNRYFRLVFCGGTCLSKAYGILERMSEDVDFKIVPNDAALSLSKTGLRTALKAFRKSVIFDLKQGGFTGEDTIKEKVRDEGTYAAIIVEYESAFEKPVSLRPHLLIEMSCMVLANSTQTKEIGLLLDRLMTGEYDKPFEFECVSLEEALAEKLISFPRRLGKHMADQLPKDHPSPKTFDDEFLKEELHWDKALVRHLFDVKILLTKHPDLTADMATFSSLLSTVIKKDAHDFKNSHTDYRTDPVKELQAAMAFATNSQKLNTQYDAFVGDMVYGINTPSYSDAVAHFDSLLKFLLQSSSLQTHLAINQFVAN